MQDTMVLLLHGRSGSPQGSVSNLQTALEQHSLGLRYSRPLMPHHEPASPAEVSVDALQRMDIPSGATIIGISLGGLVASKLQEAGRADLRVIAISSPTWADGVHLKQFREVNRLALYSSTDEVIKGRTADWPRLAQAFDVHWLDHDTDRHLGALTQIILAYLSGEDMPAVVANI